MLKNYISFVFASIGFLLFCVFNVALADVQITSLQDFNFGTRYPPYTSNIRQTDRVCIYNSDATTYRITAAGLHDVGTTFYLASGANTIRYRVRWDGPVGAFQTLNAGQTYNFNGATQSLLCADVPTNQRARLRVVMRSNWLNPTPKAGTYTDILTILLEPV